MKKSSGKYLIGGIVVVAVLIVVGVAFSRHGSAGQTASLFNLGQTANIKPIGGTASCPIGTTSTFGYITQWGSRGSGNGQFFEPNGTAVDSSGNVYVVDGANDRIQKFNSSGTYITQWGSQGQGNGQFQAPLAIAVDASGNVYVTDSADNNVQKFSSTGTFITKWGSVGSGNSQFYIPAAIAVAPSGNVYVTDAGDNNQGLPARVEEFSSTGTFITKWNLASSNNFVASPYGIAVDLSGNVYVADSTSNTIQKFTSTGTLITHFGSLGSGNGQLNHPTEIALDSHGNIYAADSKNYRFEEFSPTGAYVGSWGTNGSGNGQFYYPFGIAVDASGNVYITDTFTASASNNRVEKFGPTCASLQIQSNPINKIPITPIAPPLVCNPPQIKTWQYLSQWGTHGSGNGQFNAPQSIALDSSGNVYVADGNDHRVEKFASDGTFVTSWGSQGTGSGQFSVMSGIAVDSSGNVYVADGDGTISRVEKFSSTGTYISQLGGPTGTGQGQFEGIEGLATDSAGNLYVADTGNYRIEKFAPNGTFITTWGSQASGNGVSSTGQFVFPNGIAVDSTGNVYVVDTGNGAVARVKKFTSNGTYVTQWGTPGAGNGQFDFPIEVATDSSGNVYVTDGDNNRVQEFNSSGAFIAQIGTLGSGNGQFSFPHGIAINNSYLYVLDFRNSRVERFSPTCTMPQIQATQINQLPGGLITSAPVCKIDSFTANPNYFTSTGNSSTLTWTTSDCTSASITASPTTTTTYSNLPVNGSTSSGPLNQSTIFTLSAANGSSQPVTAQASVNITLK